MALGAGSSRVDPACCALPTALTVLCLMKLAGCLWGCGCRYKGVTTEYEFQHDPIPDTKARLAEVQADLAKRVSDSPFKTMSQPAKGYTGKNSLKPPEWMPAGPPKETGTKMENVTDSAFRPSFAGKSGIFGAFSRYPQYEPDPEAVRIEAKKKEAKERREKLASTNAWRPSNYGRSGATKSIVCMNI